MPKHDNRRGHHKKQAKVQSAKPMPPTVKPVTEVASQTPTNSVQQDWLRMKLTAELLEDTHPGSGDGNAGIDALVARDRQDRPVIWASHIEGVLRDAARRLKGDEVAYNFFGQSGGQRQRALFTSLYTDNNVSVRVWRSTARKAFDNRAPRDETLRVVEYVPKGTRFTGYVEIDPRDLSLLRRLVQEVDALGSGRATGAGRVKLELAPANTSPLTVGKAASRLLLLLRNLEPLCITATATPDNLIPSLPFVPGRTLLGALAGWLLTEGHSDTATLLVNGKISVSDALPLPELPAQLATLEVLPAPLSLQSEKPKASVGTIPWWAKAPVPARRVDKHNPEPHGPKLKRPEQDLFVYRGAPSEPWFAFHPKLRIRLRNGRPNDDKLELFAIEQIAEKTYFFCEVRGSLAEMERLAVALKPILEGSHWLRVGRGGAPVEVAQMEWRAGILPPSLPSCCILTLTSDLLMRDEYLRWCTGLDILQLQRYPDWPKDVCLSPVIQEETAIHGFNGTSRLWRMPAYGIRRGSVYKAEGRGVTELARRMAEGRWFGERTHEGFGRFRLDDLLPGVTGDTPNSSPVRPNDNLIAKDEGEERIASTTRQWLNANETLFKSTSGSERCPSLSQWLDLVASLERKDSDALTSRLNPTTAGGRNWSRSDAKAVLQNLAAIKNDEQAAYARLFVRWLRAEMRAEERGKNIWVCST
jgi:hypothetical protein